MCRKLRPYRDGAAAFPDRQQLPVRPGPDVLPDTGEQAWEVERVVGKRRVRGRVQYLVLWRGYPDHERTWEPASGLRQAPEAVRQYEAEVAASARR